MVKGGTADIVPKGLRNCGCYFQAVRPQVPQVGNNSVSTPKHKNLLYGKKQITIQEPLGALVHKSGTQWGTLICSHHSFSTRSHNGHGSMRHVWHIHSTSRFIPKACRGAHRKHRRRCLPVQLNEEVGNNSNTP